MNTATTIPDLTDDQLALALIRRAGLGLMDVARLVLEFRSCSGAPQAALDVETCLAIIRRGSEECRQTEQPPSFGQAIGAFLESKRHRRPCTQQELRYYTQRFLRLNPDWEARALHGIRSEDCRLMLAASFGNAHSRRKARIILHGLFSFCTKRGWLGANPASFIDELPPAERRVRPLSLDAAAQLLHCCLTPAFQDCAAAVGTMLWAGIRPAEVARLRWEDVKQREGIIILHPQHTKTGGARCVSILPPLAWWLAALPAAQGRLCPRNWKRKWRELHHAAGLHPWVPDVLRHSFASYHAAHYRNFEQLQYEMGHRSLQLLRYRYLATGDICPAQAADFWRADYWAHQLGLDARIKNPAAA